MLSRKKIDPPVLLKLFFVVKFFAFVLLFEPGFLSSQVLASGGVFTVADGDWGTVSFEQTFIHESKFVWNKPKNQIPPFPPPPPAVCFLCPQVSALG